MVLRDGALYALGANQPSQKFNLLTGEVLGSLPHRAGCTRATGSVDRIFVRGGGDGTFSWDTSSEKLYPISPMRPACHDGVVVAGGQLYWGPWMCGCNLSLIGIVCLGPAGDFDYSLPATEDQRLEVLAKEPAEVAPWEQTANDWPTYRGDNRRGTRSARAIPPSATERWQYRPETPHACSAPVAVGDLIFVGGSDGTVRALNAADGRLRWKAYTGGAIRIPPAIASGRVFVGSADGWLYAFEAASGRPLWRFRAAPVDRKIPVYGTLSSTWPVASGVLVEDGVAYAAAGIANYDGTHVYALDAVTGKIRWQNNASGNTAGGQGAGASVQGDLLSVGGKLYLAGGNRTPLVSYDLQDGTFQTHRPTAAGTDRRGPRGHDLFAHGDGSVTVSNWTPLYTRGGQALHRTRGTTGGTSRLHGGSERRGVGATWPRGRRRPETRVGEQAVPGERRPSPWPRMRSWSPGPIASSRSRTRRRKRRTASPPSRWPTASFFGSTRWPPAPSPGAWPSTATARCW